MTNPMTYATQQDLIDRFGPEELSQLTDRGSGTVIDASVVNRALADADAEIDGYLATRYALPLSSVPGILQLVACNIARYRMLGESTTDEARNRYADAVRWLKGLATGTVQLPGAAGLTPAVGSVAVAQRSPDPLFGSDTLASY